MSVVPSQPRPLGKALENRLFRPRLSLRIGVFASMRKGCGKMSSDIQAKTVGGDIVDPE